MKIFVYGTLMSGFGLHEMLKDSEYVGKAIIEGYAMYRNQFIPFAVKDENPLRRLFGEVYDVTNPNVLAALDYVEGGYIRTSEIAYLNGNEKMEVELYVYPRIDNEMFIQESGDFRSYLTDDYIYRIKNRGKLCFYKSLTNHERIRYLINDNLNILKTLNKAHQRHKIDLPIKHYSKTETLLPCCLKPKIVESNSDLFYCRNCDTFMKKDELKKIIKINLTKLKHGVGIIDYSLWIIRKVCPEQISNFQSSEQKQKKYKEKDCKVKKCKVCGKEGIKPRGGMCMNCYRKETGLSCSYKKKTKEFKPDKEYEKNLDLLDDITYVKGGNNV